LASTGSDGSSSSKDCRWHVGTKTDDEIWNETAAAHPFMHWEWWLGDAAFSTCLGVLTRHVQDPHPILWQDEAYINAYLNFYRQYVGHSMHLIKGHGMWRVGDLLCCCASPFSLFVLAGGQHSQQPAGLPVLQACIKLAGRAPHQRRHQEAMTGYFQQEVPRIPPWHPPLPLAPLIAQRAANKARPLAPPLTPATPPAPAAQPS
jgi:hypothetical protein